MKVRLPTRLVILVACTVVCASALPSSASAAWWAWRSVDSGCCSPLRGSRATIWSPLSSEAVISFKDFFVSSAFAEAADNLIQAGITYEYDAPQNPSCDLGSGAPSLYYFIEVEHDGANYCYNRGYAAFSDNHMHSVLRGSDGYWRAYRDGAYQEVRTMWSPCSGNACKIKAFAENRLGYNGSWQAKFAGSGYTPWQRHNGSDWVTVQASNWYRDPQWTESGPFPSGIWKFIYSG